jgi:hypothetical protein
MHSPSISVGKGALALCQPYLLMTVVGTLRFAHPTVSRLNFQTVKATFRISVASAP